MQGRTRGSKQAEPVVLVKGFSDTIRSITVACGTQQFQQGG